MSPSKTKASKLLVINRQAGTMNDQIEAKLRAEYADHAIVEFDPKTDVKKLIAPRAPVIVAGGDGTVEFFVRELADTEHPLGIVSLGTFNNFAHALGLPTDLDRAIAVTKDVHARAITLGRVNRHVLSKHVQSGFLARPSRWAIPQKTSCLAPSHAS